MSDADIEIQFQRLFALWASSLGRADTSLGSYGRLLPQFPWFEYKGDPLPAVAAHRALLLAGFRHSSLAALNDGYGRLLSQEGTSDSELIHDLVLLNVGNLPLVESPPKMPLIPALAEFVTSDRAAAIEVCRRITVSTSCGTRHLEPGEISVVLPFMCFSYAKQWDIEMTCILLRTCTYLGLSNSQACEWAREWILDQQQEDGRFGLFAPEAYRGGWNPADWHLYWGATVNAIWTIAELNQPGFMLGSG